MRVPDECPACGETATVMTMRGICLPCDVKVDADVAMLEAMLDRSARVRHYQTEAARAAGILGDPPGRGMKSGNPENGKQSPAPVGRSHQFTSVPARLGRTDDAGQRSQEAAPVVVNAAGGAP